jgi:flagellar basal body P-ring protein FlgI
MAENKNTTSGDLEKLALIADSVQTIFKGKATIVFELESDEFKSVINHFREIDRHHKQFSIDISGTEFHFVLTEEVK